VNRYAFGIRLVCALAVAGSVAAPVAAQQQQPSGGPFSGLFGGGGTAGRTPSLDVRGGLFGSYGDNVLSQAPNADPNLFDPRFQRPGMASGLDSSVTYGYSHTGHGRSATQFGLAGGASLKEFSTGSSTNLWVPSYDANVGISTNLTPKVVFAARAGTGYAPYYQYAPFLGNTTPENNPIFDNNPMPSVSPVGTDTGFAARSDWVGSFNAGASITGKFTKRSSISADIGWDDRQVFGIDKIDTRQIHGQFAHNLTERFGFHLGYGVQEAFYSRESQPSVRAMNNLFDVGLDYGGGPLSFARHYALSFTTGMSAVRLYSETQFRADGSAMLVRSIGRTWAASIGVIRGTSYILGFGQPFFSDSANAGFGGQITPRLNFLAGGGYMRGQLAFVQSNANLVSKSASTKLTFAIGRHVGVYGQYSYYQYDAPVAFFSTLEFPPQLHRRSATVGLTFWAPIINQRTARNP
jgi:hypothetical protein